MSEAQYISALERGNAIRLERAQMKRELQAGETSVADALNASCMQSMPVAALLKVLPHWGDKKAFGAMRRAGIANGRKVRDLTERQEVAIIEAVSTNLRRS